MILEENGKEQSEFKTAWTKFLKFASLVLTVVIVGLQLFPPLYNKFSNTSYIKEFNKVQALEDFDFMWGELEENYPFFDEIQDAGLNYKEINKIYRDKIENEDRINIKKFYSIVKENLDVYGGIGDLDIVSKEYFYAMDNIGSYDIIYNEKYYSDLSEVVNSEKTNKTYFHMSMNNLLSYFRMRQGFNSSSASFGWSKHSEDTLVLNIENPHQFLDGFSEDIYGSEYLTYDLHDYKNIIMNLKDENSSSNSYWTDFLVSPLANREYEYNLNVIAKDGEIAEEKIQKMDRKKEKLPSGDYLVSISEKIEPYNSQNYMGNIYLLVDEKSSNGLENFAQFCKDTGFATVIGRHTKGDPLDGLGYPRLSIFPNSGLIFQYKLGKIVDSSGEYITNNGVTPDVLVGDEEIVLNAALRYLGEEPVATQQ